MDSTYVHFADQQINRLVSAITSKPSAGLSPGVVALIAAAIGATAAVVPQFILYFLTRKKEKTRLRSELLAEERRIAILLHETSKELVSLSVRAKTAYKAANLLDADTKTDLRMNYYARAREYDDMALITTGRIQTTTADYYKTITLFTNHFGSSAPLERALKPIGE